MTQHQLNLIEHNKKLIFYSMFKTDCHKADFLNTVKNPSHKKGVNKFCLGNHRLKLADIHFPKPQEVIEFVLSAI